MRVVQAHPILRTAQEQIERQGRAARGQVPERDIDGSQCRRRDASRRERVNALAQAFDDLDDRAAVDTDQLRQQVVMKSARMAVPPVPIV